MFRSKPKFEVTIAEGVLDSIFDECDQFDVDETGGRIIGTYSKHGNKHEIQVLGVLGPGPKARRSPTSFFQDGEYQERLFRMLEERQPNLEHLGNWHTHHVNGLGTLSSGDKTTYRATVDHHMHNTDFFYALLVTRKLRDSGRRYEIKHFFFRRNDSAIYEIPDRQVRVNDKPALWTRNLENTSWVTTPERDHTEENINPERAKDEELFSTFYPGLKALFSKKLGALYWKGPLDLIDGSHLEVAAIETVANGTAEYSITAASDGVVAADVMDRYRNRTFGSARLAIVSLERDLNRSLFRSLTKEL